MKNRKFAWELFKTTGSIDAYMLLKDVEYSEEKKNKKKTGKMEDFDGAYKDEKNRYKNS